MSKGPSPQVLRLKQQELTLQVVEQRSVRVNAHKAVPIAVGTNEMHRRHHLSTG